jgi:multidrug efflux pump subunit AcrB
VLSLLIIIAGSVAISVLPIAQYPEITPPTVTISTVYPGADAETVSESVAGPIEQQLSGVDNLLYYSSTSANNGSVSITATFEIGTDQDLAAVDVQNQLKIAEAQLPEEVKRNGITVQKRSSNILAVFSLQGTEDSGYDDFYLSNYALINVIDRLRRVEGVGDVSIFGSKDYSMRIWLDPDKLASKARTDAVAHQVEDYLLQHPGIEGTVLLGGGSTSSAAASIAPAAPPSLFP